MWSVITSIKICKYDNHRPTHTPIHSTVFSIHFNLHIYSNLSNEKEIPFRCWGYSIWTQNIYLDKKNIYISIGTNGTFVQIGDFLKKMLNFNYRLYLNAMWFTFVAKNRNRWTKNFPITKNNEMKKMSNAILGIVYAQCDELYLNATVQ